MRSLASRTRESTEEMQNMIQSLEQMQTNQGARELEGSSAELGAVATRLQQLISTFKTA